MINSFAPFKPPFKYDGTSFIWDSQGNIVLTMRGFGLLLNHHKYDKVKAAKRQDEVV